MTDRKPYDYSWIDFSPMTADLKDLDDPKLVGKIKSFSRYQWISAGVGLLGLVLLIATGMGFAWFVLFLGIIVLVVLSAIKTGIIEKYRREKFLRINGFSGRVGTEGLIDGTVLAHAGDKRRVGDVTLVNDHTVFFEFEVGETEHDKDGHTSTDWTEFFVLKYDFKKQVPHILIDSGYNNLTLDPGWGSGMEKLSLEGGFNKTFRVMMDKGNQIAVLQILTPDVMADLLDYGALGDIEVVGTGMLLVMPRDGKTTMRHAFMRSSEIIKEFDEQVERYGASRL